MHSPIDPNPSRREFLKASSTLAAGGALASGLGFPSVALGAATGDKLKIGFVGCGGRGTGAARQALSADSNVELYAMADVLPEKIEKSLEALKTQAEPQKFNIPPERRFVGLDAYQKVINSGVDVVILTTPPGFRPMQFKAAVEAGKHIFLEKPMATDAPGLRSVMASVQKAKEKKLAVVAGFCLRYDAPRRAFFRQIHDGAIGEIKALYHSYLTGPVKPMPPASERPAGMSDIEWQVRNWYNFTWTCGDGLVEQAVHSVDKMAWAMKDVMPARCTAVGGRMAPNNEGNIYDHIEVNYEWENGVRGFLAQRQVTGCFGENKDLIMGTKGNAHIGRRGKAATVEITGEKNWSYSGPTPDMYQVEHDEFFASIRRGKPINNGDRMCTSTMMAIMGRMAAYSGLEITWDMALNSQERLVPEHLDWNGKHEVPPIAMPGKKKFV
ncbi:MAG: Gfo/Idh/MocA family oxidoreductase [Verrucomicrobia bacterium]|nr:Gfo/Idh/MocA family oxidoreductase [Verrucomicrobiota bacterium]